MLLSEALEEFFTSMVGVKAEETLRWYRYTLRSLPDETGDVEIGDITTSMLRRWRTSLLERDSRWESHPGRGAAEGGLSAETVRGHVRAAKVFFNWLVAEEALQTSPAKRLQFPLRDKQARKKAVNPEDVLRMLKVADTKEIAVIRFLADTGCRVSGLCGLKRGDLDLESRQATVIEKGRGGGKLRTVFFGDTTAEAIDLYLSRLSSFVHDPDYVFVNSLGEPFTPSGIHQMFRRVAKRAGVTGRVNPHAFRHGWAKEALKNGADLGTVSQVLGHSDISVTHEFYSQWEHKELATRHDQFSWLSHVDEEDSWGP